MIRQSKSDLKVYAFIVIFFTVSFRKMVEVLIQYFVADKNIVVFLIIVFTDWKMRIILKQKWMLWLVLNFYLKHVVMHSKYSQQNGFWTNIIFNSVCKLFKQCFHFCFSFEDFSKSEYQFEIGGVILLLIILSEQANKGLRARRKIRSWLGKSHKKQKSKNFIFIVLHKRLISIRI